MFLSFDICDGGGTSQKKQLLKNILQTKRFTVWHFLKECIFPATFHATDLNLDAGFNLIN